MKQRRKIMISQITNNYTIIAPKKVEKFINENEITIKLLNQIEQPLRNNFPDSKISLELCDKLDWTDETKLLVNISVDEEMFFNGILDNFNNIYKAIQPILDTYVSTTVLFPEINNKNMNSVRMNNNSAVNLIARTAYFNTYHNYEIEREITLRDIPREQQKEEIIQYCHEHDDIFAPDIEETLKLDFIGC